MGNSIFFHVDMNSAFLSMEAAYQTKVLGKSFDLRTVPSVIAGSKAERHGIILAKSVPCKRYGIKTGEPIDKARAKCPNLIVEKANYGMYVEASRHFVEILKKYTSNVEQYSIDECWMDMSEVHDINRIPVLIAHEIKDRIKDEMNLTVNIGVSENKLLAKMASDFSKPDRVHTLFQDEIKKKMWGLPVSDLFGVGRETTKKLSMLGIKTIGELANTDILLLRTHLKSQADILIAFANGQSFSDVGVEPSSVGTSRYNKGYGNSYTIPMDVTDYEMAHQVILSLCETVGARMRADNVFGALVTVYIRYCDFFGFTHQLPLKNPTDATGEIYKYAVECFDAAWNRITPIRKIGVRMTKITNEKTRQYNIFEGDLFDRMSIADHSIDDIRFHYGENAIIRARFANSQIDAMGGGLSKERRTGPIGTV
jgi:DNA polymerase IV